MMSDILMSELNVCVEGQHEPYTRCRATKRRFRSVKYLSQDASNLMKSSNIGVKSLVDCRLLLLSGVV